MYLFILFITYAIILDTYEMDTPMAEDPDSVNSDFGSLRDFFNMERVVRRYASDNVKSKAYADMLESTRQRKRNMFNAEAHSYIDACIQAKMVIIVYIDY